MCKNGFIQYLGAWSMAVMLWQLIEYYYYQPQQYPTIICAPLSLNIDMVNSDLQSMKAFGFRKKGAMYMGHHMYM